MLVCKMIAGVYRGIVSYEEYLMDNGQWFGLSEWCLSYFQMTRLVIPKILLFFSFPVSVLLARDTSSTRPAYA